MMSQIQTLLLVIMVFVFVGIFIGFLVSLLGKKFNLVCSIAIFSIVTTLISLCESVIFSLAFQYLIFVNTFIGLSFFLLSRYFLLKDVFPEGIEKNHKSLKRYQVFLYKLKAFLIALLLGTIQYVVGGILIFYGSVIDPTWIHVIESIVGFVFLLPFSALLFIPGLAKPGWDIIYGLMSLIFWFFIYYLLFKKILRPKFFIKE